MENWRLDKCGMCVTGEGVVNLVQGKAAEKR